MNFKQQSHFQGGTTNREYINKFSEFIWNITGTFMELLPNSTKHFSRHQTILIFSKSYWQIMIHIFPEFISSNTEIFWGFLPKLNYSENFFQSLYHTILTLSDSCYQTIWSFDPTKNKLDCYRDKDCMERFCRDLKEHATRLTKFEKKNYTTDR